MTEANTCDEHGHVWVLEELMLGVRDGLMRVSRCARCDALSAEGPQDPKTRPPL